MGGIQGGVSGTDATRDPGRRRPTIGRRSPRRGANSAGPGPQWPPLSAYPLTLYFITVLVVPVGVLLLYSFWTAGFFTVIEDFTLENYDAAFTDLRMRLLFKTMWMGFVCASILAVVGLVVAYALTFKMGRWGQPMLLGIVLTLLASYLVRIYAWTTILGTNGILNRALLNLEIIDEPLRFLLYGRLAVILTLVYVYLPFSILIIYGGLQNMDPAWLEASRDMGAGRLRTFTRITVPVAMPAVRSAFALCFILTATDYVTPGIVGGLRGQMYGNVIESQFGGGGNFPQGAALSFILVLAMVGALAAIAVVGRVLPALARLVGRGITARPRARRRTSPAYARLLRFPATQAVTVVALAFLAIPLGTVIFFSFNSGGVPGLPFKGFSLRWYEDVLGDEVFHEVLATSLKVIAGGVGVALLLAVPAAFALARHRFRGRTGLQIAAYGPVTVPGVMVGVALLSTLSFLELSNGMKPTIAAHALLVVPVIVLVVEARLRDLDRRIEEAGRDLGASPARVLRTIVLPLIGPSLAGAALLAAAISLDETIVTNFVAGKDPTIPVWILSRIKLGVRPSVNAIATMLMMGSVIIVLLAGALLRRDRSGGLAATIGARR